MSNPEYNEDIRQEAYDVFIELALAFVLLAGGFIFNAVLRYIFPVPQLFYSTTNPILDFTTSFYLMFMCFIFIIRGATHEKNKRKKHEKHLKTCKKSKNI